MSNAERQRRFRERNPHYYRDRKRREKAAYLAYVAEKKAQEQALAQIKARTQLCLPAPEPVVTLEMLLGTPDAPPVSADALPAMAHRAEVA